MQYRLFVGLQNDVFWCNFVTQANVRQNQSLKKKKHASLAYQAGLSVKVQQKLQQIQLSYHGLS